MKRVVFETVSINGFFAGKLAIHREIIQHYANRGYSYKGFVPTKIEGYGNITEIDLVFEKEEF